MQRGTHINKVGLQGHMKEVLKVSAKGHIVIPENVRKKYSIRPGTRLILSEQNDALLLQKEEDLSGLLRAKDPKDLLAWQKLAESSLKKVWDNPQDERAWKRYDSGT
jgi:AbrB family looped-hinge helix DNA binding protein